MSRGFALALVLAVVGVVGLFMWNGGDDPVSAESEPSTVETEAESNRSQASGRTASRAEPDPIVEHRITGSVTAAEAPVVGAVVHVRSLDDDADEPGARHTVRTDDAGRFEVPAVSPGRYAVSATAAGLLPRVESNVDVRGDVNLSLVLEAGGHPLTGTVSDVTGGPVEGALVRLVPLEGIGTMRGADGFGTMADEDGAFSLQVKPGRYRMEASHEDYAADERAVEVGPGAQSQDFALVPMGVIEGVVVESDGTAVPRARVSWERERQVTIMPGQRMMLPAGGGTVLADERGRFVLRGLAPGAVRLSARAPQRITADSVLIPLAMAEHVGDVELVVAAAHDLRGRVVAEDDSSQGIAGAKVQLMADGPHTPRATTDAEGNFVLRGLLEGPVTLLASAPGYRVALPGVTATVAADADEVVLPLRRAPMIVGRVEPPTEAQVSVELRPETMQMGTGRTLVMAGGGASARSDASGQFELEAASEGAVTLVARVADGRAGEVVVDVGPDGAQDVVINLEDRATVHGLLRSTSGAAVAQAMVTLRERQDPGGSIMRLTVNGRDMGSQAGTTTDDGRYEVAGLSPGDYEVNVVDRYGESMSVAGGDAQGGTTLTVAKGASRVALDLTVDAHDGVIRGQVTTADGEPAPDVWVHATLLGDMPTMPSPEDEPGGGEGPTMRSEMRMVVSDGSASGASRPPVLTDDDGRFEFTGLRDADYELMAEAGGGAQRVSAVAKPGDRPTLKLADLATLEGSVTLDGQPLKRFLVRVDGPSSRVMQVRDNDGRFSVDRLDPGSYSIEVTAPDGAGRATATLEAGQTASRDIVLEHGVKVTGRIVDEQGNPMAGVAVMVGSGENGRLSIEQSDDELPPTTDEDGRFEVTCAAGPRGLIATNGESPMPILVHFFVAQPGQDMDVGDLKPQGNMIMGGVAPQGAEGG